jgi:hypothetical protein
MTRSFIFEQLGQMHIGPPFSHSLDIVAAIFFLLVTVVVSCDVRCSSFVNIMLAVLTTAVLVFVMVAGPIYGDISRFDLIDLTLP